MEVDPGPQSRDSSPVHTVGNTGDQQATLETGVGRDDTSLLPTRGSHCSAVATQGPPGLSRQSKSLNFEMQYPYFSMMSKNSTSIKSCTSPRKPVCEPPFCKSISGGPVLVAGTQDKK